MVVVNGTEVKLFASSPYRCSVTTHFPFKISALVFKGPGSLVLDEHPAKQNNIWVHINARRQYVDASRLNLNMRYSLCNRALKLIYLATVWAVLVISKLIIRRDNHQHRIFYSFRRDMYIMLLITADRMTRE